MPDSPDPTIPGRSRKRRNVVGGSAHREEYVRMIKSGWSSASLEKYALWRYGEDIPARTFRAYRSRAKIEAAKDPLADVTDELTDVVTERARLIKLQKTRIAMDVSHERNMSKLFGTTRHEIGLLSQLLTEQKVDLQDLGVLPKAGEKIEISEVRTDPSEIPQQQSLAELFGAEPGLEPALARVLHMNRPQTNGKANGASH